MEKTRFLQRTRIILPIAGISTARYSKMGGRYEILIKHEALKERQFTYTYNSCRDDTVLLRTNKRMSQVSNTPLVSCIRMSWSFY